MISEREGCEALAGAFEQRGYRVARDVRLEVGGLHFQADGWDVAARVGFEYLTHEAADRIELSPPLLAQLAGLMARDELHMLLVGADEVDTLDELAWAAHRFLDEVERRKAARSEGA